MLGCSIVKNLDENQYILERNIILKDQKELINDPEYLLLKIIQTKKYLEYLFKPIFTACQILNLIQQKMQKKIIIDSTIF